MKIAVIILNFNNYQNTTDCIQSLMKLKTTTFSLEIIVVDNGSDKKDMVMLKREFPNLLIIENKVNLGFAMGNNVGIKKALVRGADYVLLLNNDTIVSQDFLTPLVKVLKENYQVGIVSPKIYFAPGYEFHKQRYQQSEKGKIIWYAGGLLDWENMLASHNGVDEVDRGQYEEIRKTDFATGCCLLIKKKVFEDIGFFNNQYFLYWEDIDFCQRAKNKGWQILYAGKTHIWHKNASSSGGAGADTSVYYQTRNRLLFGFKYASLRTKIALLRESIRLLFAGKTWQKKAIWDCFLLKFGQIEA